MINKEELKKDVVMEFKFGQMEQFMKAIGKIIKQKVKEHFGMQKEIYISVNSKLIKQVDLESILI